MPKQLLFGWLPQARPAHGPRLRWKDRVADDLGKLDAFSQWYEVAQQRSDWRSITHMLPCPPTTVPDVSCEVCGRKFKSKTGLSRHKCTAVRQLPINEQPGARQCGRCLRWFRSAGGFAVHKCQAAVESSSLPSQPPSRTADSSMACCSFHCSTCDRCFKSGPGFRRHNCLRGKQRTAERDDFEHHCPTCPRKFRRASDLKRHKCR